MTAIVNLLQASICLCTWRAFNDRFDHRDDTDNLGEAAPLIESDLMRKNDKKL